MGRSPDDFIDRFERQRDQNTGQLLLKAARLYNERAVGLMQSSGYPGLRAAHTAVFPHLDLRGTRLTTLAQRMGVTKQAVGQLVDDLEKMGLLARAPDPTDKRAKLVTLTSKGQQAMFEGLEALAQLESDLAKELPAAQLRGLARMLGKIVAVLESGE